MGTNCIACGRFVSHQSMVDGAAKIFFEPDNHFGPERSEWTCAECANEEAFEDWRSSGREED